MRKKFNDIVHVIYPYNKINIFVFCLFFLGLIFGSVFNNIISINDKNMVIDVIKEFISDINNSTLIFKDNYLSSLLVNFLYLSIIFFFGMTLVGLLINFLTLFFKGFSLGFTLSSFILTYRAKGLILSSLYILLGQFINIIAITSLTIYSISFSFKIFQLIFMGKNTNIKHNFKSYALIYIILLVASIISSLLETLFFPNTIKLLIKLFM